MSLPSSFLCSRRLLGLAFLGFGCLALLLSAPLGAERPTTQPAVDDLGMSIPWMEKKPTDPRSPSNVPVLRKGSPSIPAQSGLLPSPKKGPTSPQKPHPTGSGDGPSI